MRRAQILIAAAAFAACDTTEHPGLFDTEESQRPNIAVTLSHTRDTSEVTQPAEEEFPADCGGVVPDECLDLLQQSIAPECGPIDRELQPCEYAACLYQYSPRPKALRCLSDRCGFSYNHACYDKARALAVSCLQTTCVRQPDLLSTCVAVFGSATELCN